MCSEMLSGRPAISLYSVASRSQSPPFVVSASSTSKVGECDGSARSARASVAKASSGRPSPRSPRPGGAGRLGRPLEGIGGRVAGAGLAGEPAMGGDGAHVVALALGQRRHRHDDRPPLVDAMTELELAQIDVVQLAPRLARLVDAHELG